MLRIGFHPKAIVLVAQALRQDLNRYKRSHRKLLNEAGNLVRKKQREILKAGPLTQRKGHVRRYNPKKGKITRESQKTSRLVSQHRVRIRWSDKIGGWEAFVGPTPGGPAFYGKFHELGTGRRTTASGASRGSLDARPWMRPAIEATVDKVEEILGRSFKNFRIVR